jgi:hypothetical protein
MSACGIFETYCGVRSPVASSLLRPKLGEGPPGAKNLRLDRVQ